MHLQRVRVPEFRALKNVDITFESDLFPRIFPLGSLNGGGKSTLLQLIFVLLHCSPDPEKVEFVQNMLYGFGVREGEDKRTLAILDLKDGDRLVTVEFFVCDRGYLEELIDSDLESFGKDHDLSKPTLVENLENPDKKLQEDQLIEEISETEEEIKSMTLHEINEVFENLGYSELELGVVSTSSKNILETIRRLAWVKELSGRSKPQKADLSSLPERVRKNSEKIQRYSEVFRDLEEYRQSCQMYQEAKQQIAQLFRKHEMRYLCYYSCGSKTESENILASKVMGLDETIEVDRFVREVSQKVFLAAPATQVFLFLSRFSKNLLFAQEGEERYGSQLHHAKSLLSNLFTYDFTAIDLLVDAFSCALEKDRRNAILTGEYSNFYQELVKKLRSILGNKSVNVNLDLESVTFRLDDKGKEELYPEDLSHGELKRLSIYTWIYHNQVEDAIVLMDEIGTTFHPDWQFQIVRDLQDWSPSNQYILATHSYELCQALTPAHVKEIEPKLIPQKSESEQ